MSKYLLDAVIGTPPPSTVDVMAIMRRRRRVVALRRVGIAATSVIAASAMVVAGLSFASGHRGRGDTGPAAPVQIMVVPFGMLSPDLTAQDLADAVVQAMATVAPDAHWDSQLQVVASPTAEEGAGGLFGGGGMLAYGGRTGRVAVAVGTIADAFVCVTEPEQTCVLGSSPGGATMVTRGINPGADGWIGQSASPIPDVVTTWWIGLALADGVVLEVYAYASKYLDSGLPGTVLSEAELVTVVEDVASRITS